MEPGEEDGECGDLVGAGGEWWSGYVGSLLMKTEDARLGGGIVTFGTGTGCVHGVGFIVHFKVKLIEVVK